MRKISGFWEEEGDRVHVADSTLSTRAGVARNPPCVNRGNRAFRGSWSGIKISTHIFRLPEAKNRCSWTQM